MEVGSLTKQLVDYILQGNVKKANKTLLVTVLQGIIAGMYVAVGGLNAIKLGANIEAAGIGDFLGAVLFPTGVIGILIVGAELFTSNCMSILGCYTGKSKVSRVFRFLLIVLLSNIVGGIIIAIFTYTSSLFSEAAIELVNYKAVAKTTMPFVQLLSSSILCNIIVCSGICLSYLSKEEIAKIAVLMLTIAAFVVSGTEHVVANAYYLFAGLLYGAEITFTGIIYNLAVAALGNFIGGGVIVTGMNYLIARDELVND